MQCFEPTQPMGGSPGDVSEEPVTKEKRKKGWRMICNVGQAMEGWIISCDVGEVTEMLENELCCDYNCELCSFSNPSIALPMLQVTLQLFPCFNYVRAHSPTLLSLLLCHRLFTYDTWQAAHGPSLDMHYQDSTYLSLLE